MATIQRSISSLTSPRAVLGAFKASSAAEAVIKGIGTATIVNRVNAWLGNPLGSIGLSFTVPFLGIQLTPFTLANYFLLDGLRLAFDMNAFIGAIAAVFAGVNPGPGMTGAAPYAATINIQPGSPPVALRGWG